MNSLETDLSAASPVWSGECAFDEVDEAVGGEVVEDEPGSGAEAEDVEAGRISALAVRCACARYVYSGSVTFEEASSMRSWQALRRSISIPYDTSMEKTSVCTSIIAREGYNERGRGKDVHVSHRACSPPPRGIPKLSNNESGISAEVRVNIEVNASM